MTTYDDPTGHMMRLPIWATGILLAAGVMSVAFPPRQLPAFVWVVLMLVNVTGVCKYFGDEISRRLKAPSVGHKPADRKALLLKGALLSQAMPAWLGFALTFGSMGAVIAATNLVGLMGGFLLFLALLALLFGGAASGHKAYKTPEEGRLHFINT